MNKYLGIIDENFSEKVEDFDFIVVDFEILGFEKTFNVVKKIRSETAYPIILVLGIFKNLPLRERYETKDKLQAAGTLLYEYPEGCDNTMKAIIHMDQCDRERLESFEMSYEEYYGLNG